MVIDIVELHNFYKTALGKTTCELVTRELRMLWENLSDMTLLGIGYACPYLEIFTTETPRIGNIMPATQGAIRWSTASWNQTLLGEPTNLPFPDGSIDRLILAHVLELHPAPHALLRESWRILKPEGRLIVLVPNKYSPWAYLFTTPFGGKYLYSCAQVEMIMRNALFRISSHNTALGTFPFSEQSSKSPLNRHGRTGCVFFPGTAGLLIIEGKKDVYCPINIRKESKKSHRNSLTPARTVSFSRTERKKTKRQDLKRQGEKNTQRQKEKLQDRFTLRPATPHIKIEIRAENSGIKPNTNQICPTIC
ncbi:MAG: methyltransferase domain-containing protein [Alphaproteobacteria bacterium]|nr:methyltransferase domain-containing protein [Alphaproteobacteria bacterium]